MRRTALFLQERSVDPRHLTAAAVAAAKHRGIDLSSGDPVWPWQWTMESGGHSHYQDAISRLDRCELRGRMGGSDRPLFPTRPVKGQMLCVVMPEKELVSHVIRTPDVYLIPRSDGRLVIGATQEEAGFDKRTVPKRFKVARRGGRSGAKTRRRENYRGWAGLRPGTPDALPILGSDINARIFYRDRPFSRWHPAGAGHGASDGASDCRRESRI